jgi:hypothetical protein
MKILRRYEKAIKILEAMKILENMKILESYKVLLAKAPL